MARYKDYKTTRASSFPSRFPARFSPVHSNTPQTGLRGGHQSSASRDISGLGLLLRAGVGGVVDFGEMLEIEVRVDLGRRNARMTEHLLDGAQVTR